MIRVLKRDGTAQQFDRRKLAGALWRAIGPRAGCYGDAAELASAIGIYLRRRRIACVSSAAILEMSLKVLRRVGLEAAADAMEGRHLWREVRRRRVLVSQPGGRLTCWQKSWMVELVRRSWGLSPGTARVIAAELEQELLGAGRRVVLRRRIVDRMNELVVAFGLADAVPVSQYAPADQTAAQASRP